LRKTEKDKFKKENTERLPFSYKKKYGQNFLHDTVKAARIVEAASPDKEDVFVEIGPGSGSLTRELAPRVKKVVGVEIDQEAIKKLKQKNLQVSIIRYLKKNG